MWLQHCPQNKGFHSKLFVVFRKLSVCIVPDEGIIVSYHLFQWQ